MKAKKIAFEMKKQCGNQ